MTIPRPDTTRDHEYSLYLNNTLANIAVDDVGEEIEPQSFRYGSNDTVILSQAFATRNRVANFRGNADLIEIKGVEIVLTVPANTPRTAEIYLAGDFNRYFPRDPAYQFKRGYDGRWRLSLPELNDRIEFAITRGDGARVEARQRRPADAAAGVPVRRYRRAWN